LRFEIQFKPRAPGKYGEHRADFAGGAARNIEERDQFIRCAALKSFGEVVGDGERGALELVTEGAGKTRRSQREKFVDMSIQVGGCLSDGEIFKALVRGHGGWDMRFEI